MKTSIKAMAAIFMAALVWTGCIDTNVPEAVERLREAQVAYLQAQADLQAALAEEQQIANDFATAMNAIAVQEAEAELQATLAWIDVEVREAQAELEEANLEFEEALAAYEQFINEQGLEEALEYLSEYEDAVGVLNALIDQRLELEAELAKNTAILNSPNATWEIQKGVLEDELADLTAQLAAQEAAVTALEAVQADPATAFAQASALRAEIEDLENLNVELEIDAKVAFEDKEAASAAYDDAGTVMTEYENLQASLEAHNDTLETYNEQLADAEENLADLQADLTAAEAALADYEAAFQPYLDAVDDAQAAYEAAVDARDVAEVALNIAQANYQADSSAANLAARDAAQADYNTADQAVTDAQTDLTDAQTARDASGLQTLVNNAETDVNNITAAIETEENNIADKKVDIAEKEGDIADVTSDIAAIQVAYDDAVANIGALYEAKLETLDAYNAIEAQISANDNMITSKWGVITVIENELDNLNQELEDAKGEVATTRGAIEVIEQALADEEMNRAAQEDLVNFYAAEVERLDNMITGQQAIVDKWLSLLEDALG